MHILLWAAMALTESSSPYAYEISSGIGLEPNLGYLFQDTIDSDKLTAGLRLTYLKADQTDAMIAPELQVTTATSLQHRTQSNGEKKWITNTDYLYEAGAVFTEIFNPMSFRFALGGGAEMRKEISASLYYRAGLGGYWSSRFGAYLEFSGRFLIRTDESKFSYPMQLSPCLQMIF